MERAHEEPLIARLNRDIREASRAIGRQEARFLVDTYYQLQKDRIRSGLRVQAAEEFKASTVLAWVQDQSLTLEKRVATVLGIWVESHPMGEWMLSVHGIGPIISAGLLANLDIEQAPTAGHFWAICGLDPSKRWEKGKKRPWNGGLKRLCFLIGESFVKTGGSEKSFYGPVYKRRKEFEWRKNLAGDYADQAREALASRRFHEDEGEGASSWYKGDYNGVDLSASPPKGTKDAGKPGVQMLPPGRIQLRAKRYAVKLFLAHLHDEWHVRHFGRPGPAPYPIAHLGHAHVIEGPESRPGRESRIR